MSSGFGSQDLTELQLNKHLPLDDIITTLEAYFRDHPPATVKEAQHEIERLTGIKRSETQGAHS